MSYNAASRTLNQLDFRHINTYFSLDISYAFRGPWLPAMSCIFALTVSQQSGGIMMPSRHCALPHEHAFIDAQIFKPRPN